MNGHPTDRLSAYIDEDLAPDAQAAIDAHIGDCDACRAVVEDLERIRATAAAWASASAEPGQDLWPAIAARLEARGAGHAIDGPGGVPAAGATRATVWPARPWYRRRWSVGVPELALAALLVGAVVAATWYQGSDTPAPSAVEPAPIVAEGEVDGPPEGGVVSASFADAQYEAAVRDLEQVLLEQRDRLDPRTVIVVERNLRVIDDAIREARQALDADPANALLNSHLASARRRKLDLLRRAALITEAN